MGRIIYVTPGYQMIALDAETGTRLKDFGLEGIVDLKQEFDQSLDLETGEVGLHAAPIICKWDCHRRFGISSRKDAY